MNGQSGSSRFARCGAAGVSTGCSGFTSPVVVVDASLEPYGRGGGGTLASGVSDEPCCPDGAVEVGC